MLSKKAFFAHKTGAQERVQHLQQQITQEKTAFINFVKEVTNTIGIKHNDVVQTKCNNTYKVYNVHILQVLDTVPAEATDDIKVLIYARRKVKRTGQWSAQEDFCLVPLESITHVNDQPFTIARNPLFI